MTWWVVMAVFFVGVLCGLWWRRGGAAPQDWDWANVCIEGNVVLPRADTRSWDRITVLEADGQARPALPCLPPASCRKTSADE